MEQNQKKLGSWLTAFLTIFIIIIATSILSNIINLCTEGWLIPRASYIDEVSTTALTFGTIIGAIVIISLALIIKFKKIGIFLYCGAYIVYTICNIIIATSTDKVFYHITGAAVALGIMFILLRNKFKEFN